MGIALNLNFINMVNMVEEFTYADSSWMLTKDRLVIDFSPNAKGIGFYGRKTTTYKNIVLNKKHPDSFYEIGDKFFFD